MPRKITISEARDLLHTAGDLDERGMTERQVRTLVANGTLRRVRRGRYVFADDWNDLWVEGRHLVEVVAVHLNSSGGAPLFWGPSAAVLLGLPLYRHSPSTVHLAVTDARHGRTRSGITWHRTLVEPRETVWIDGLRCTSVDRTVLDIARGLPAEVAISVADAALRDEAVEGHEQDPDRAAHWHERLASRLRGAHGRGVRQARRIVEFADGRAQLPGESVSRLHLYTLGFRRYDLQMHVVGPEGEDYWLDFGFLGSRCFGEFDGKGKYLDDGMRAGKTPEEVVIEEKRREDAIRGVTGWRIVRWGWSDIAMLERFSARLEAFRIRPPG